MKFQHWLHWVKSLPFSLRWFVYLILIRPIIDNFYDVKLPLISLSPLEIIGVLTPGLIILFTLSKKLPRPIPSKIDFSFHFWSVFVLLNGFFIIIFNPGLSYLEIFLKITAPIYLFHFVRRFVRSIDDLEGILQTLLYAAIFPALMFIYELLFSPIKVELSRGLERSFGGYADVFNYSIYLMLSFIVIGYFSFSRSGNIKNKYKRLMIFVLFLGVAVLFKLNHVTSFVVFLALFVLFVYYNYSARQFGILLISAILIFGLYNLNESVSVKYTNNIYKLVENDLQVVEGNVVSDRAFHGRFSRWIYMWASFEHIPFYYQLLAPSASDVSRIGIKGAGAHNDFLRMIFQAGYVGLFAYLLFLSTIFKMSIKVNIQLKFLVRGALIILILFSITSVPTIYFPLMYIILAIFAYISLPVSSKNSVNVKE